jgi:hypothetical protein
MFAAIALLVAVVLFRLVLPSAGSGFANFTPLAALALCGAAWLPKRLALALPLAALFISDLILNARYGVSLFTGEMIVRYGALLLVAGIGLALRDRRSVGRLLLGSVAGSVIFYLLTNSVSWMTDPAYAKTAVGWVQALTTGVPGVQPQSWVFFRNALIGDLFFTALFVACMAVTARKASGTEVADKVVVAAR